MHRVAFGVPWQEAWCWGQAAALPTRIRLCQTESEESHRGG